MIIIDLVLVLVLGLEGLVLVLVLVVGCLVLVLVGLVLDLILGLECLVLVLGLEGQVLVNITASSASNLSVTSTAYCLAFSSFNSSRFKRLGCDRSFSRLIFTFMVITITIL